MYEKALNWIFVMENKLSTTHFFTRITWIGHVFYCSPESCMAALTNMAAFTKAVGQKGMESISHNIFTFMVSTDQMRRETLSCRGEARQSSFFNISVYKQKNNKRQNYSTFPMTTSDLLTSAKVGQ